MRGNALAAVGLALALTACTGTHVVYVHEQTLGVDLAATSEGTNKFNVGYDREAFAVVPRIDRENDKDSDAMSVTAISRTYIQGISNIEIGHCIATGDPALFIAKGHGELHSVAERVFVAPQPKLAAEESKPKKPADTEGE